MTTNDAKLNAVTLILSDARGTYIPRDFVCDDNNVIDVEHCAKWGLTDANRGQWEAAADPENESYWDAWDWILNNAEYVDSDGDKYRLHQDGDLWGICYDRMTAEEKSNFGFNDDMGEEPAAPTLNERIAAALLLPGADAQIPAELAEELDNAHDAECWRSYLEDRFAAGGLWLCFADWQLGREVASPTNVAYMLDHDGNLPGDDTPTE